MEMKRIARIHTDFASKFGVPRQSGLVPQLQGRIVFEPEYRNADAVRGMEDFSHLWLVWEFSEAVRKGCRRRYVRHVWEAIGGWGCLQHVLRFVRIRLHSPA